MNECNDEASCQFNIHRTNDVCTGGVVTLHAFVLACFAGYKARQSMPSVGIGSVRVVAMMLVVSCEGGPLRVAHADAQLQCNNAVHIRTVGRELGADEQVDTHTHTIIRAPQTDYQAGFGVCALAG